MTTDSKKVPEKIIVVEHKPLKSSNWFMRSWKDPVGSKLIAGLIIFIITAIYGLISNIIEKISLIEILKNILFLKIELYILLIIIICSLLLIWFISWLINRNKTENYDFILKERIGDISFSELYNSLISHFVKTPPSLSDGKNNEIDLLTCFLLYIRKFGIGVTWNHPGDQGIFMYYTVGPILIAYGLFDRVRNFKKNDNLQEDIIVISEKGRKFYQLLNIYRTYNKDEFHEW